MFEIITSTLNIYLLNDVVKRCYRSLIADQNLDGVQIPNVRRESSYLGV